MSKKILSTLLGAICLLIIVSAVSAVSSPAPGKQSQHDQYGQQSKYDQQSKYNQHGKFDQQSKYDRQDQHGRYGIPGMFVTAEAAEPCYTEFEDLNGKTIGLNSGAPFEELIKSKIPEMKEFLYFSSGPDMQAAHRGLWCRMRS